MMSQPVSRCDGVSTQRHDHGPQDAPGVAASQPLRWRFDLPENVATDHFGNLSQPVSRCDGVSTRE